MSLDVYLTLKGATAPEGSGIFIREAGAVREITRAEWDEKFPGWEPITVVSEGQTVYSANITHNLGKMAAEAQLYEPLWRPDEVGITRAFELVEPLEQGLALLRSDPPRFRRFNPSNGWGDYEGLVKFVEDYLAACRECLTAEVSVSR